jgi:hypothetical protein
MPGVAILVNATVAKHAASATAEQPGIEYLFLRIIISASVFWLKLHREPPPKGRPVAAH